MVNVKERKTLPKLWLQTTKTEANPKANQDANS